MFHPLDHDAECRDAANALGQIGLAAIPALMTCLGTGWLWGIGQALVTIGPPATPALIEALLDPDSHVRSCAAKVLGAMGPAATRAIPALKNALEDANEAVRQNAAHALEAVCGAQRPLDDTGI